MTDEKLLSKVRKLLAQAEGTDNKLEAEAFTAKATQLIVDNGIDAAKLAKSGNTSTDKVVSRTFTVEGYAKAKVQLLYNIAKAIGADMVLNRNNRSGWSTATGTIVGWESDLDAIDVLFASLTMQVTSEMGREAKRNPHVHGRAFKQAFILGFANEVGTRLKAQRAKAVKVAEDDTPGTALAVVERSEAVVAHFKHLFPSLGKGSAVSLSSRDGYGSGKSAGQRANLGQTSVSGGRKALSA